MANQQLISHPSKTPEPLYLEPARRAKSSILWLVEPRGEVGKANMEHRKVIGILAPGGRAKTGEVWDVARRETSHCAARWEALGRS